MRVKLITTFVHPPIPSRLFDWCVYPEGDPESFYYGWGRTELDAIEDWKENFGEYDCIVTKEKKK